MELRDVSFKNQQHLILQSVSFSLATGLVGLLGDNGQGKTTLLQIMSGLLKPSGGRVLINHEDIYQNVALKHHLSYVPAHSFLYPHMSLIENFHVLLKIKRLSENKLTTLWQQFFSEEEQARYRHVLYGKLSDGLKKRAMLIAGLLPDADYYFLDEPCTALSTAWRQSIWQHLHQLAQMHCVVVSSHHPEELTPFCDEAYVIQGKSLHTLAKAEPTC